MQYVTKISSKRAARVMSAALALAFLTTLVAACGQPKSVTPQSGVANQSARKEASVALRQNPIVRLTTELGNIDIELYTKAAPITAANFLAYIDAGLYSSSAENQVSFYRTVRDDNQAQNNVKISVVQGGLMGKDMDTPVNDLPSIKHETTEQTGIIHTDGTISLARLEPGSGSSEFFITIGSQASLDFGGQRNADGQGFAAFGKVVHGMETVKKIHQAKTIAPEGDTLSYTSGQFIQQPIGILSSERLNH